MAVITNGFFFFQRKLVEKLDAGIGCFFVGRNAYKQIILIGNKKRRPINFIFRLWNFSESVLDELLDFGAIEISYSHNGLQFRTIPFLIKTAQGILRRTF